jgi:hypothetical protein
MLATVNQGSLNDSLNNYLKTARSVQGTRVPAPFKKITDTIGNIFQQMAEKISTLSGKVDDLNKQREAGVNLAKSEISNLTREERINKLSPLITELGQNIVNQNFKDHDSIENRVHQYSKKQAEEYAEQGAADFAPDPTETFNAIKYNYERSYGSLFLTQLNTQPQIKEMLGKGFPFNTFSSPIDVENELILGKVQCLKTVIESQSLDTISEDVLRDNKKDLTKINLDMMPKGINITDKNILPNLLVSVAIEPRYSDKQREIMVKAVLNHAFNILENRNTVINNN